MRNLFLSGLIIGACCLSGVARGAENTPVLMIGDSMMRLLSVAMEKELRAADVQPASSFSSLGSGLARLDAFDWFAKVKALMAERKPATVVVTLGANDRQALKDASGQVVQYGVPEWEAEYSKRIGHVMDEILNGGAKRVIWLLLPDMKVPAHQEYAMFVNTLITKEAQAESRKGKVVLFDMRPLLTRKPGTFAMYVMSPTGLALSVRDSDGVHLTKDGARIVAVAVVKAYWK